MLRKDFWFILERDVSRREKPHLDRPGSFRHQLPAPLSLTWASLLDEELKNVSKLTKLRGQNLEARQVATTERWRHLAG